MDKKKEVIGLWRACFDDTEEFINFYFSHKYEDENAQVFYEESRAVAALQMLPYPMSWGNTSLDTSYISGACTLPQFRNRGIMAKLLKVSFEEMLKRNIPLSTLIPAEPWLFDYYKRFGYTTIFDYSIEQYTPESKNQPDNMGFVIPQDVEDKYFHSVYSYFARKMNGREYCIQHQQKDYCTIIKDLYISGGYVIIANGRDAVCGMAFVLPVDGKVIVNELLCDSTDIKIAILEKIGQLEKIKEIECKVVPQNNNSHHSGMARIIDAQKMLSIFAGNNPHITITISLSDNQLGYNNGFYIIDHGNVIKQTIGENPDFEMDIPLLTQVLSGYRTNTLPARLSSVFPVNQPYMSLMMD